MMDGFLPVAEAPPPAPAAPAPAPAARPDQGAGPRPLWAGLRAWRPFLAVVVAPTLLASIYVGLVAAPQYQSEAHFIVRTAAPAAGSPSGLGALLGLGGGASQGEARSVEDYLVSHDAVDALQRTIDLTAAFRRPEADVLSRLGGADRPAPETVLKYFRRHVRVTSASDTGISVLTVRAFRPRDAQAVAETLLKLGEARVNSFNRRALEDGLSLARGQLAEAEAAAARSEGLVTSFRQARTDIDPERSSAAAISLASTLEGQLAVERARLAGMSPAIAPDSPQRMAEQARVSALAAQVGAARGRMAGPRAAMAPTLGAYESLRLRQEFASKRYEGAAAALETARTEALRQQLYVVRVVEPNLPVKALYPERLKTIGTLLLLLLMGYGVGWLVVAGVREHAA